MVEKITKDEVKEFYEKLGNPSKINNFSENSFFNFFEKDEHLSWKSLNI